MPMSCTMVKSYISVEPKSLLRINKFRPSILVWQNVKPNNDSWALKANPFSLYCFRVPCREAFYPATAQLLKAADPCHLGDYFLRGFASYSRTLDYFGSTGEVQCHQ